MIVCSNCDSYYNVALRYYCIYEQYALCARCYNNAKIYSCKYYEVYCIL